METGKQALSPLQTLLAMLASNQTQLSLLHIPFYPNETNCRALQTTLTHNTTLRGLSLRTYADCRFPEPLTLIAQALAKNNSTLEEFEFLGSMRIRNPGILQEFAQILEVNYTLQELVLFELVTSRNHSPEMNYHAKLNQHGRKQWLQEMYQNNLEKDAVEARMEFLEQLAKDQDDLFYYLSRMNPSFLQSI